MESETGKIGCILMASGLSARYGKNKLLEKLNGREVIWHTATHLMQAGLVPLAVTRSREVQELLDSRGIACILHDGAKKSDTMHQGMKHLEPDTIGYLFMPADQPLVLPATLRKLVDQFLRYPQRTLRLGFGCEAGSPVLFPASFREDLLAYRGDRGGIEVLKEKHAPCDILQASYPWELWDVDTPEKMEQVRAIANKFDTVFRP
ncbi:MAG: nucleotidyltransferase family protein [Lachnospiraceae bacterium]|nr:nucleotidyltransferase family protein [Lachnospiraceae bacterium]